VKFLVDAQLPAKLAGALAAAGHDALHTTELPGGNRTTDAQIASQADAEERVVVTKDADFRDGHLITGSPRRLLVVATGNISNTALLALFERHLENVVAALTDADFVELRSAEMVVHRRPDD
jgi:predicted nuclease of predicted toxin-antitoxin system